MPFVQFFRRFNRGFGVMPDDQFAHPGFRRLEELLRLYRQQSDEFIARLGQALQGRLELARRRFTVAQTHEAEANLAGAVAQLDAVRQQVRLEVDQARLAVRAAKAASRAAKVALTSARDRLQQAEARYQNGAGSVIELGDAQIAEAQAGAQVVQSDLGLATARAQLLKALGR